ncbi:hypothetical protein N431DRAFT_149475 [Stipitochalara longipes BDJ]|nr:hypothetical protein N431DRAFT_149475 [Stipitochalara longipes BDJ]
MSVSSTTLSQASRERGRVSSVVNERLAVGQKGSGQKAECQSGRIGRFGDKRKRAATRKSLGSSRSQTQRQTGVNAAVAVAAGTHSLMRVKSCICSRMQAVWIRQFDWRIGCWLHHCMLAAELRLKEQRGQRRAKRASLDACVLARRGGQQGPARASKRCQWHRDPCWPSSSSGCSADTPPSPSRTGQQRVFTLPRATERSVVEPRTGSKRGADRSPDWPLPAGELSLHICKMRSPWSSVLDREICHRANRLAATTCPRLADQNLKSTPQSFVTSRLHKAGRLPTRRQD